MLPGTVIDRRFVLEVEHRSGGIGTVWKALDRVASRAVAVKVLHAAGPEHTERFDREAALLSGLAHPNLVSYVAHGTTGEGVPYLAMEWLDGESLSERLARRPLTLDESLAMLRCAVRGLGVAHRAGVVHRDLKPSNLFLRDRRPDDVVVLDLGIARRIDATHALTRTGSILGTPSYMAPEQAQGHADVLPAADVFSLGCVLFECLAGAPPFTGAHVFTVLAKILFEETPRLRDARPEIPAAVEALVERMLVKDPARRLADAPALEAALGALGPLPVVAPPGESRTPERAMPAEQELVSVILATPGVAGTGPAPDPLAGPVVDVSTYGAEQRRLADGTALFTVGQGGGAATDLAVRAARCALRVREARPAWRIAVATGRGVPRERIPIGEAVDRAASLLHANDAAGPGAICLDEVTARLVGARFRTRRVAEAVFVLEGEDPSIDPTRPLLGKPTSCVGREQELGTLELALRACAEDSAPRAVLVVGAPGMGKSRLRHELVRRVRADGRDLLVLLGQGDPIRSATSCGLLGDAVSRLCGVRPEAAAAENLAAIEAKLAPGVKENRPRTVSFLGELCGVRAPADASPELRAARQSPRVMADCIEQAWLAFLRAEASLRPVLVELDDLQWSDALTVKLVDAALRELGASPFLVLALARPEVQERFPGLWAPRLAVLPLRPLAPVVTARFVRQVLGDRISDDGVQRIVARAEGNALCLEELIRAAEDGREEAPETVMAMLQARIGLLPPAARRVLRAASVLGETFPLSAVAAVLREGGTDVDLAAWLAELRRSEILEERGGDGRERWRFRHVLMRDAAYALLTAEDRRASHAAAARFLESTGEDPAVIAAHHERGGDRDAAVRHYIAAADGALRRFDYAATIALVRSGLAAGAEGQQRGVLRGIEGQALTYVYEFAAGWEATREALSLLPAKHPRRTQSLSASLYTGIMLGRAGEVDANTEELVLSEPRPEDLVDYVAALGWASISHTVRANRDRAARLLARIGEVEAGADAAEAIVHSTSLYWSARFLELLGDDPHAAWQTAAASVREGRISGDRRLLASALGSLGDCARRLSLVPEGVAAMREAIALSDEVRDPTVRDFMRWYLAMLLAERGTDDDLPEARALATSVLARAVAGSPYHGLGALSMALVALREGDPRGAEAHARSGRQTIRALGLRGYYPHADATLLLALTRSGDGGAAALADDALLTVERLGPMGIMEVPLRALVAHAQLAAGRREEAVRGVEEALARVFRQGAAIPDPALRARFVSEVPENAALSRMARELGVRGRAAAGEAGGGRMRGP